VDHLHGRDYDHDDGSETEHFLISDGDPAVAKITGTPIVRKADGRPAILHVDDDVDVLDCSPRP